MPKPFTAIVFSLSLGLSLTLFSACQSDLELITPPEPEPVPSPSMPDEFYNASPDLESKTEANVFARHETRRLTHARLSPSGDKVLYTYDRELMVILDEEYGPAATRNQASGLWLYDTRTQTHREVFPPQEESAPTPTYPLDFEGMHWWNDNEIAYLTADRRLLLAQHIDTGYTRVLLERETQIDAFTIQDQTLFALDNTTNTWIQINADEQTQTQTLPYGGFYWGMNFEVIQPDQILFRALKRENQAEKYPFQVATEPPPPRIDSFLFRPNTGEFTPISVGLELSDSRNITLSPGGHYLAVQRDSNTLIYTRSGTLLKEQEGDFFWLNDRQILIQNGMELTQLTLDSAEGGETTVSTSQRTSLQAPCENPQQVQVQAPQQTAQPLLMECLSYASAFHEPLSKVFQFFPMQALSQRSDASPLSQEYGVEQHLLPAESGQPPRLLEHTPGRIGAMQLSILREGQLVTLFQQGYPQQPAFGFNPKAHYWELTRDD